eukprot:TRINITY_DN2252_c0_g1_i10.p1 TRINITY_DN2252_c0_g1~~TRINITY_DN2252_c0_g1_i10.p1  ORF type:complete len:248 (+),score=36.11 TRINITY_DN2252_c0_g1_i10:70-813(+)
MFASLIILVSCSSLSITSATEEEVVVIQPWDQQLTRSDIVQSHNDLRMRVVELNGLLFDGNVLRPSGGGSESWVVAFCPSWWEGCQPLEQLLLKEAATWHGRLNSDDFSAKVRFAVVDCATDKLLCNREGAKTYPTIAHYSQGQQLGQTSLSTRTMKAKLETWLKSQLQSSKLTGKPVADVQMQGFFEAGSGMDIILMLLALAASVSLVGSHRGSTKGLAREFSKPQPPKKHYLPVEWRQARTRIEL